MPTPRPQLERTVSRFRGPVARGLATSSKAIDPVGGNKGAGLIRGFAVITRGEALGHYMWIDNVFLQQVADAMSKLAKGLKSRFTHPDMSGDSLGTYLGRAHNGKLTGDIMRADLHFAKVAHETPDGDLAGYVMGLADEDPEAFGSSIVFRHDAEAENAFYDEHVTDVEYTDDQNNKFTRREFRSPDPDNVDHLPHCRLSALCAVDIVDSPAANPSGMFHRTKFAHEAEQLAAFALGLSDEAPKSTSLGMDPQRLAGFAQRFLAHHHLEIVPMTKKIEAPAAAKFAAGKKPTCKLAKKALGETMPPKKEECEGDPAGEEEEQAEGDEAPPADEEDPPADEEKPKEQKESKQSAAPKSQQFSAADLKKFTTKFGAENGVKWLSEGKTYEEALGLHCDDLEKQLGAKSAEATEAEDKLASLVLGETKPLSARPEGVGAPPNKFAHLGENLSKVAAAIVLPK